MPIAPLSRFARPRWLGLALALLTLTCGDPIMGPAGGMAELRLVPVYPQLSAASLLIGDAVDNVRVEVRRQDNTVVLDTTVAFPAASETLELTLRFPMEGASEPVTATVQLRAGTEVLFEGTLALTATGPGGGPTQPPEVTLNYVGEGADALTVEVTPSDSILSSRDSVQFTAVARNAQASIVDAPIEWTVAPEALGTIDANGMFRGSAAPGTATVTATTPTGVLGTATLELEPTLQSLALVSGDVQSAPVMTAFAVPLVVRAVDGATELPGTIVQWSVVQGRAELSADADTADAAGLASVTVTADTLAGPVTVRADADGITRDFALTVAAGEVMEMLISNGDAQTAVAGTALAERPRVKLLDGYANPVPGVMVSYSVSAGGGSLEAPRDRLSDAAGLVEGPVWTLGIIPGTQRIEVASGCLRTVGSDAGDIAAACVAAEFTATALVAPTMTLQLFSGDGQTAEPGSPLPLPLVVRVENSDVAVESVPVQFTVMSGGGLLSADTVLTDFSGAASVDFTVGATGEQQVRASVGSLEVFFNVTGAPTGFSRVWLGATDDWHLGSNWTGGAVPTATDSVYIPAGTPNAPRLTGAATTATLVMDDPRGLNVGTFTLVANGSVRSVAPWTGTGRLDLQGNDALLAGFVGKASILAPTTLDGATTIGDTLWIEGGAALAVGAHSLMVEGALIVMSGSQLQMRHSSGQVVVSRDASFSSAAMGDTAMTAGLLELRGDFSASSDAFQTFRATGTHRTRFAGSTLQTINFAYPAAIYSRFQHLELANASGVQLLTSAYAHGNVSVEGTTPLSEFGSRILGVGGAFTSAAGTALTVSTITSYDGTGASFPDIVGSYPGTIRLASGTLITLGAAVTMPSHLVLENGSTLDPGQHALSIGGTLLVDSDARLRMLHPAGHVTVLGDALFNSLSMGDSLLVAGTLELHGDFTATSAAFQTFRAAGSHLTRFVGSALQTINFAYPAEIYSRFRHLEFDNAAGVQLLTHAFAHGNVSVAGTTPLSESGVRILSVGGAFTSAAGTAVGISTLTVYNGTGPAFPSIAGTYPGTIRLASGTLITLGAPETMPSNLVLESGTAFDPGPHAFSIGGTLNVGSNARLRMLDPAGQVTVLGDASFNSLSMGDSLLVAGTLELHGDFSATSAAFQTFRAAGTHLTRFVGSTLQTINFAYPAEIYSRFHHLELDNAAGVQLLTHTFAHGNVAIAGTTPISESGARTLSVGGLLTSAAGTLVGVTTLTVYDGVAPSFPNIAGTFPGTIRLASGTLIPLSTPVTMTSNLVLESSTAFDPGPHALSIGGSLDVTSNARLRMVDPAGLVTVFGDATFGGLSMGDSLLVAGTLELRGDFSANSAAFQTFRAAGSHLTRFAGTALQTIAFAYPADIYSRFNALHISNASAGGVSLSSSAFVLGTLNQEGRLTVPLTRTLDITGGLQLQSGSNTDVLGTIVFGSCSALGGQFTGFSCP